MFGKMKQRDAEEVLGDMAKQDRRNNRARESVAPPASVRGAFNFYWYSNTVNINNISKTIYLNV